jgi:putative ABC transport system permease protein
MIKTLRHTLHEISSDAPAKFKTMKASLYQDTAEPRFRTFLLVIFAGLSVCLAIGGIYGLTAYAVSQRSHELGVRMAMGATPRLVGKLVLKQGLVLAAIGITLGLGGSFAATRLLTSILFEVKPNDPEIYICAAVLLAMSMLAASYLPAQRASRLDPLAVLQQE